MFKFALRDYQKEACRAAVEKLKQSNNALIVLPTGGGKTAIISALTYATKGRVLIVSHRKELISQTAQTIEKATSEKVGVFSAGLNKKELEERVIIAGIQSIYKRAKELLFNVLIVDEVHLIPKSGQGQYIKLLNGLKENNESIKIIGLTATPYRLDGGLIYGNNSIFDCPCYNCKTSKLIEDGFLSPLVSFAMLQQGERRRVDELEKAGKEFKTSALDSFYLNEKILKQTVSNLKAKTKEIKSCLVFCSSIAHLNAIAAELSGESLATITAETGREEREKTIEDFKRGLIKYLLNVDVLTTGFDAPNVDAVALLRATLSPGLYVQMIGRGLRKSENKNNCLVLDFGGNVLRHGGVDCIDAKTTSKKSKKELLKICPKCKEINAFSSKICSCGYEFKSGFYCPNCGAETSTKAFSCNACGEILRQFGEVDAAENVDFINGGQASALCAEIKKTLYLGHVIRRTGQNCLEIKYICKDKTFQEFLGFECSGFLRARAVQWFKKNFPGVPVPFSDKMALQIINFENGAFCPTPKKIYYKPGGKFPKIERVENEKSIKQYYKDAPPPYCGAIFTRCPSCGSRERRLIKGSSIAYEVCTNCGESLDKYSFEKAAEKSKRLNVSYLEQDLNIRIL